jgi:hypothetical protein
MTITVFCKRLTIVELDNSLQKLWKKKSMVPETKKTFQFVMYDIEYNVCYELDISHDNLMLQLLCPWSIIEFMCISFLNSNETLYN